MLKTVCATWVLAAAALGQQGLTALKRVDAGVADLGPLSTSQRLVPVDMRVPVGFDGVYQLERPAGWGKTETMYVRMSGGVAAVFPRSVYVPSKGGLVPEIPAGTVFMIGGPPQEAQERPKILSATAVDLTYRPEADDRTISPSVSRAAAPQTIWTSERLRQTRVQALLEQAQGR